jgi:branched-chain amino acid transport system substrate-binding protein
LSGDGASYARQQAQAIRLAVAQVNRAGGIDSRRLSVMIRDDHSDPQRGTRLMRQFVGAGHALAVLGPTLSNVAVAADPIANRARTPVLAISNTSPGIVGNCANPCGWVWRNSVGESTTIPDVVDYYVAHARAHSVALIHSGDDLLARNQAKLARAKLHRLGVPVPADVTVPAGASSERLAAAVRRVLADKPAAVFIGSTSDAFMAEVMRDARSGPNAFSGTFLGGDTFNGAAASRAFGRAGKGALSGTGWVADNSFRANQHFVHTYKAAYGTSPGEFAAQAFTGVQILAQAIHRSGIGDHLGEPLAKRRQRLQRAFGDVALTTPLGVFRFNREHDVQQIVWIVASDGAGGHHLVSFCDPTC